MKKKEKRDTTRCLETLGGEALQFTVKKTLEFNTNEVRPHNFPCVIASRHDCICFEFDWLFQKARKRGMTSVRGSPETFHPPVQSNRFSRAKERQHGQAMLRVETPFRCNFFLATKSCRGKAL